jgi:hypothetical protein
MRGEEVHEEEEEERREESEFTRKSHTYHD